MHRACDASGAIAASKLVPCPDDRLASGCLVVVRAREDIKRRVKTQPALRPSPAQLWANDATRGCVISCAGRFPSARAIAKVALAKDKRAEDEDLSLVWFLTMTAFAAEYGPALEGQVLATEMALPDSALSGDTGAGGTCSDQHLQDGEQLPDLPLFYVRAQPHGSWGSAAMIDLLVEAGRHMSWLLPQASPFVVGDISTQRGGYLAGHISHRGGIDADVGIYRRDGWQHSRGFTLLAPSELDVEATWTLISTMLATGNVDFILLDRRHIDRLYAYVLSAGLLTESEAARIFPVEGSRFAWEYTGVLRHAPHHQDHLHVRVLCGDGKRAH